jgi:putative membrane-bound dehydrogenase-like protein
MGMRPPRVLSHILGLVGCALLFAADGIRTTTTYQQAYGTSKGAPLVDASKELPRYPAVEPAAALSTWKVKPGFKLQLAAQEPQVRDPIALCFDERGRMFVCEMIDYSERRDETPHLGRVSVLEDKDGDGHYETSRVFADNLPWPTGLIWANGGLYVIATPDIWRFEDRAGRGVSDHRERVFTGFGTGMKLINVQGMANSMQWGPDQRIHLLAGGGNRGKVSCLRRPELPAVELGGNDFWFDPLTHEFGLESGGAQYGMSYDDYGRKFGCSNSDHLQHWVHDRAGQGLNPYLPLPAPRSSIAKDGGAAEVFRISPDEPWRIIRTRWRVSGAVPGAIEGGGRVSGYFTGATGTTIYRGDAYGPAFKNNSFTGDAGGQLIHRKVITPAPDGVNLSGERPADERGFEFAASRDTWVRVVNFANAPDGCLHVCDMYREVIEHPWSIPDEIKKHLDLNSGNDRGRIYRLVPDKKDWVRRPSVDLAAASTGELVATLAHPNGWHRDTATRLLYERRDPAATELLRNVLSASAVPLARLHALNLLAALETLPEPLLTGAMEDSDTAVRERAIRLAGDFFLKRALPLQAKVAIIQTTRSKDARLRFQSALTLARLTGPQTPSEITDAFVELARKDHDHAWIAPAILTAHPDFLSRQLLPALATDDMATKAEAFLAQLIYVRAKSQPAADRSEHIDLLIRLGTRPAHVVALSKGLPSSGTALEQADASGKLTKAFVQAGETAKDSGQAPDRRVAALALLAAAPLKLSRPILSDCLAPGRPTELQAEAVVRWGGIGDQSFVFAVIEAWDGLAPSVRPKALTQLLQRPAYLRPLLHALGTKKLPANALDAGQIQSLLKLKDPQLAAEARRVLADVIPPSREVVTAKFAASIDLSGDAVRGLAIYQRACLICHRAAGQGMEVGPDLLTVKNKGRTALLEAILHPNKEVAAQYMTFQVQTRAGETYLGIIAEDTATQLTLRMPGGISKTILRAEVAGNSSEGRSLMPEGLEGGLSTQDMADLLTFIETLK